MGDLELDSVIMRRNEQEWEAQTAPEVDGETLRQAAKSLNWAIEDLDKSADWVNDALTMLLDKPVGDRVGAMLNDMENLLSDLKAMKSNFERGSVR